MFYLLTLPIRLIAAGFFLFMSFLWLFGPATKLLIAYELKHYGEEANAIIEKRVKSRRTGSQHWTKQYYVLRLPQDTLILYTPKRYSVGKSIDVIYFPEPPGTLDIPFTQGKQKLVVGRKEFVVQGRKKDWLIQLYLASAKKNFADYSITHTTIGCLSIYLAIMIMFPFLLKRK